MAGKGGRRAGAGRKAKPKLPAGELDKSFATEMLLTTGRPIGHIVDCMCRRCRWWGHLAGPDARIRFEADKYLGDKVEGKAVQTVNHVHDKPIEMNVNLSMAEIVRKVRERKAEYERSR